MLPMEENTCTVQPQRRKRLRATWSTWAAEIFYLTSLSFLPRLSQARLHQSMQAATSKVSKPRLPHLGARALLTFAFCLGGLVRVVVAVLVGGGNPEGPSTFTSMLWEEKAGDLQRTCRILGELGRPHLQYTILRYCLDACKVTYLLRTTPMGEAEDEIQRCAKAIRGGLQFAK